MAANIKTPGRIKLPPPAMESISKHDSQSSQADQPFVAAALPNFSHSPT
jgi:hypothetical protein